MNKGIIKELAVIATEEIEGVYVEPIEVLKNNVKLQGLTFRADGERISPSIYFTEEDELNVADGNLQAVVDRMVSVYLENRNIDARDLVDDIIHFEKMAERLRISLVQIKGNEEYLERYPFRETFGDLAATVFIDMSADQDAGMTATVTHGLLDTWEEESGIDFDVVYRTAVKNTGERVKMFNVTEYVMSQMGIDPEDIEMVSAMYPPMIAVTTDYSKKGAGAIIPTLDYLEGKYDRFLIIPSSIHEVIIVADCGPDEAGYMSELVPTVNEDQVEDSEVLCDHAYYWDGTELLHV